MEVRFHIQDPSADSTVYLFESFLDSITHATKATGVFAFASQNGVDSLVLDPIITGFLGKKRFSLVVGIDAVTNRQTLERLLEHQRHFVNLDVRVFWNPVGALFHPKMARFDLDSGAQRIIVGSGNLTPGGLRGNFEAYSVITASRRDKVDFTEWDSFMVRHGANLRAIDVEALERAARNIVVRGAGGRRARRRETIVVEPEEPPVPPKPLPNTPFLIAQVPAAAGRWYQIHFNAEVVQTFLMITANSSQRLFIQGVDENGNRAEQEVRPCVYSEHNMNYKVEFAARRELPYPAGGRPILIMKRLAVRTFEYMLIMPGEAGHAQLWELTLTLPRAGRGLARVITDAATVGAAWVECPLLAD
jgi:HKD family nuclease